MFGFRCCTRSFASTRERSWRVLAQQRKSQTREDGRQKPRTDMGRWRQGQEVRQGLTERCADRQREGQSLSQRLTFKGRASRETKTERVCVGLRKVCVCVGGAQACAKSETVRICKTLLASNRCDSACTPKTSMQRSLSQDGRKTDDCR